MEKLIANAARFVESLLLHFWMSGQNLVTCAEVKAIFGGCYPDDVWRLFSEMPKTATRAEVLEVLRVIANRHQCGSAFAAAVR